MEKSKYMTSLLYQTTLEDLEEAIIQHLRKIGKKISGIHLMIVHALKQAQAE